VIRINGILREPEQCWAASFLICKHRDAKSLRPKIVGLMVVQLLQGTCAVLGSQLPYVQTPRCKGITPEGRWINGCTSICRYQILPNTCINNAQLLSLVYKTWTILLHDKRCF
jgi:hypothetical protein